MPLTRINFDFTIRQITTDSIQGRKSKPARLAAVGMNLREERKQSVRQAARRRDSASRQRVDVCVLEREGREREREREREKKWNTSEEAHQHYPWDFERESGTARTEAADETLLREMVLSLSLSLSLSLTLSVRWRRNLAVVDPTDLPAPCLTATTSGRSVTEGIAVIEEGTLRGCFSLFQLPTSSDFLPAVAI